jgi:rhodanese-related sulfurtransferase
MKIKLTFFLLFSLFSSFISAEELVNLSAQQLIALQKDQNALVIDIRTEKEWLATGTIPNSYKMQFFSPEGKYDTEKWLSDLNKLKTSEDQPIILVCRSGGRSGKVGNMLSKQLGMKNIHHLSNGMMSWIKTGNEVNTECPTQFACK